MRVRLQASGYAAALADLTGECVMLTPMFEDATQATSRTRFSPDGTLEVRIGGSLCAACL